MKRIGLVLFMILTLGAMAYAQDETLTLLTYYPAPYGVYQQIRVQAGSPAEQLDILADQPDNFITLNMPVSHLNITSGGRIEFRMANTPDTILIYHQANTLYDPTDADDELADDVELVRITGTGRVGIGTANPGNNLDVIGNAGVLGSATDAEGVKIHTSYINNATSSRLLFTGNQDNTRGFSWLYADVTNPTLGGTTFNLPFSDHLYLIRHEDSATGNIVMQIDRWSNIVTFPDNVDVMVDYRLSLGPNPGYQARLNVDGAIDVRNGTIECDGNVDDLISAYLSNNNTDQWPPISAIHGGTNTRYGAGVVGRSEYNRSSAPGDYAAGVAAFGDKAYGLYAYSSDNCGIYAKTGSSSVYAARFRSRNGSSSNRGLGVEGYVRCTGTIQQEVSLDIAEWIKTESSSVSPGDVVVVVSSEVETVRESDKKYDYGVAGIISTNPGMILGYHDKGSEDPLGASDKEMEERGFKKLAIAGRVLCNASCENGPVYPGDLLTTSSTPGYAMKAKPIGEINGYPIYPQGCIVGKALEPLKEGKGKILVLVCLM